MGMPLVIASLWENGLLQRPIARENSVPVPAWHDASQNSVPGCGWLWERIKCDPGHSWQDARENSVLGHHWLSVRDNSVLGHHRLSVREYSILGHHWLSVRDYSVLERGYLIVKENYNRGCGGWPSVRENLVLDMADCRVWGRTATLNVAGWEWGNVSCGKWVDWSSIYTLLKWVVTVAKKKYHYWDMWV